MPLKDEVNDQCNILHNDESRDLYNSRGVFIIVKYRRLLRQCSSLFRSSHGQHVGRKSEYVNIVWLLVAWCIITTQRCP
jgi:hypothetical protein